jgi:hypothetical protein
MRQNVQQKRGRGRSGGRGGGGGGGGGGGNRPYSNPAGRSYDSNGPEVKVRGTAMNIYEKYQQLARDASSSGDRIGAENYLQHAEHYYRLMIANNALQQQQQQQNPQHNGQRPNGQGPDGANAHGSDQQPRGPVTFGMDGEEHEGQPSAPPQRAVVQAPEADDDEQPDPQPRS